MIFGFPVRPPFEDKILKNEPLQHMLEPLGSQDGPKVAASRPRLKIDLKWCPKSILFCYFLVVFHVIRETEHTPQVSMDFPVSFASTVWGGEGSERGETLGEVGMKAPSHFGVHFHTKAGFKKTSQKRPPI